MANALWNDGLMPGFGISVRTVWKKTPLVTFRLVVGLEHELVRP
jgi:hypothetical protein